MQKLSDAKVLIDNVWFDLKNFKSKKDWLQHFNPKAEHQPVDEWENVPEYISGLKYIPQKLFEIIRISKDENDDHQEALFVWLNHHPDRFIHQTAEKILENFKKNYCGSYQSKENFAEEWIDQIVSIPESLKHYFDINRFADDIFREDFEMIDPYVFKR